MTETEDAGQETAESEDAGTEGTEPEDAGTEGTESEVPVCNCEGSCTAENMNESCPVCGADGAAVENCREYVAPAVEEQTEAAIQLEAPAAEEPDPINVFTNPAAIAIPASLNRIFNHNFCVTLTKIKAMATGSIKATKVPE